MVAQSIGPSFFNSPANGATVGPVPVFSFVLVGASTGWSVKVEAWSAANGGGSRVTCGSLSAKNFDKTTSTVLNTFTGSAINTATASSTQGTSGHTLSSAGGWATSGSPASLGFTLSWDNAWGVLSPLVRRSGVWQVCANATDLSPAVRRSSSWRHTGARVRRSGVWKG